VDPSIAEGVAAATHGSSSRRPPLPRDSNPRGARKPRGAARGGGESSEEEEEGREADAVGSDGEGVADTTNTTPTAANTRRSSRSGRGLSHGYDGVASNSSFDLKVLIDRMLKVRSHGYCMQCNAMQCNAMQ
jgi:hypothetical protein